MPPKKRFITCEICKNRASRSKHEKRIFMARFPLDEARCKQWVKFVGKEDLIYVPIEKLHALKYVCGIHFHNRAFNEKKSRLKRCAIPSENLKGDPLPDEMLLEFPCHIYSNNDATTTSTSQGINNNETSLFQAEPSNSGPTMVSSNNKRTTLPAPGHAKAPQPSTSSNDETVAQVGSGVQKDSVGNHQRNPIDLPTDTDVDTQQDQPCGSGIDLDDYSDDPMDTLLVSDSQEHIQPVTEEKTFSWQTQGEAVPIHEDEPMNIPDNVSLYCDDEGTTKLLVDTSKPKPHPTLHEGFQCNECGGEINGFRYVCVQCSDLDMCGACEAARAHARHYVLRVPAPAHQSEVQAVLATIRKLLMKDQDPMSRDDDAISIKSEVKSEDEFEEEHLEPSPLSDSEHSEPDHLPGSDNDADGTWTPSKLRSRHKTSLTRDINSQMADIDHASVPIVVDPLTLAAVRNTNLSDNANPTTVISDAKAGRENSVLTITSVLKTVDPGRITKNIRLSHNAAPITEILHTEASPENKVLINSSLKTSSGRITNYGTSLGTGKIYVPTDGKVDSRAASLPGGMAAATNIALGTESSQKKKTKRVFIEIKDMAQFKAIAAAGKKIRLSAASGLAQVQNLEDCAKSDFSIQPSGTKSLPQVRLARLPSSVMLLKPGQAVPLRVRPLCEQMPTKDNHDKR